MTRMINVLTAVSVFLFCQAVFAEEILVDDFNEAGLENSLGEERGVWNCNDNDSEQYCEFEIIRDEKVGESGSALMLSYDLTTGNNYIDGYPGIAYNGYWTRLGELDVSNTKSLTFYVKGDKGEGFTQTFWIELKDSAGNVSRFQVRGVSSDWQKVQIPLNKFSQIKEWSSLYEFVVVFDQVCTNKEGVLYIDDIKFE
ncbi:MAG: hypothetical protein PHO00_04000 [bacterium]|nr:hypothetical protein [bacterium]